MLAGQQGLAVGLSLLLLKMTAGDIIVINEDGWGKKGNYFDGTDDYVLHDAHAVARVAGNDTVGTYTAWIYIDEITTANTYAILSAGDNNSASEFLQFYTASGELGVDLTHASTAQFRVTQTTGTIPARTWTHVAVVQNGTRPTLYVNGIAVAMTDEVSTDLTFWYDELTACDKFAIGVKETNNTHLNDFKGAIGQVKYFNIALTAAEILVEFKAGTHIATLDNGRATAIETARVFDITMEDDGTTDDGSGADDGTLTGGAIYGGEISDWSYKINANVTGHAAEFINTVIDGKRFRTIIKRGD